MTKIRFTLMAGALLLAAPALAEDAHHPAEVAPETPSRSTPVPATQQEAPGGVMPGGMMMPGMMSGDMMQMMMRMMMSGGQSPMTGEEMGRMASSGPMGPMAQMMSPEHVEGRIAFLRTELKVTPAQEPLWEAVAEALREGARASEHMMQQRATAQTLLSALEGRERALSARLESVRRLRAVVEPFYAALDETQKATADKLMEPMGIM
ncbi:MAG: Spy/CpxP family protein refolding chaperone [Rhizobiaceae bacterium]|nr:MAG: Spy/CpxP family protein refolding chaperone [Rhizobiaceae bacterium]CAG1012149.1 hypothetical protein RHIZO_04189 [Rhizobiaceae bacterium]